MHPTSLKWTVLLSITLISTGGCMIGPTALRVSRSKYNQAIQNSTNEQLLLNLVRLKYRDVPLFLEVGSVSAQFVLDKSAGAGVELYENLGLGNPDTYLADGRINYSEKPTITYSPLQGEDFVKRVLSPLEIETVMLLTRSGWNIDRVWRLTIQRMNNLPNAPRASGPTPSGPPEFEEFTDAMLRLRKLQHQGLIDLGYVTQTSDQELPISSEHLSLSDHLQAAREGYQLRPSADGRSVVRSVITKTLVLSIKPQAMDSSEVRDLLEDLGLEPGRHSYALSRGAAQQDATTLFLDTRSLMGVLFYLSQGVEIPDTHEKKGLVTRTPNPGEEPFDWTRLTGDLMRIRCSFLPPQNASVSIRYRGHWFYIDDSDLNSKSTFALLSQLIALQSGTSEGNAPLLTLPVGGG